MKQPQFTLLILSIVLSLLAACSPGGAKPDKLNCSSENEVCVSFSTVKSFAMGDRVPLKITVTSSKDIDNLYLELDTGTEIIVDGPQTWEKNISNPSIEKGLATGRFSIKAGQTLTFNRVLHFPSHEGTFFILIEVVNPGRIIDAVDSFNVLLTQEDGGQVILSGTPFPPHTPIDNSGVYGPGTPVPIFKVKPTHTRKANPHLPLKPLLRLLENPTLNPTPLPTKYPRLRLHTHNQGDWGKLEMPIQGALSKGRSQGGWLFNC